jgi:hypothetical protein
MHHNLDAAFGWDSNLVGTGFGFRFPWYLDCLFAYFLEVYCKVTFSEQNPLFFASESDQVQREIDLTGQASVATARYWSSGAHLFTDGQNAGYPGRVFTAQAFPLPGKYFVNAFWFVGFSLLEWHNIKDVPTLCTQRHS